MAAEAVLSLLLNKVSDLLLREVTSLGGVGDQVQLIQRELNQMRSFLRDAEEKQITSANVKTWLADIQDIAYDAGDLIDTFTFNKEQQWRRRFFKRYALIPHDFFALRKFAKEIVRLQNNILRMSDRRSTYGIENIGERGVGPISPAETLREQRRTSPHPSQTIPIVGLSKDVELLTERLLVHGNLSRSVVSIVGMGGLGKTTLARTIYNSDIVRRHFDCFVWIYVSQSFEPKEFLREIEQQLKRSNGEETSVEESLIHRKYLIVLDDVWTTDVWTRLQETIPDSVNGSKIILTTRIRDVGIHADEVPHEVQLLNEQDSWMLFTHFAFKGKYEYPSDLKEVRRRIVSDLKEVGKRIVQKCEGLPLSIVLIGSLLRRKDESSDAWSKIFDSLSWHLNQHPKQYSSILALSYYDLPDYLKPCFLYFGIFTEGFEIPVKKLIRMWIAEGFVQQRGIEELEDVGTDYIEELVDRNLIQVTHKKESVKKFIRSAEIDQKTKTETTQMTVNGKSVGRSLTCSMHGFVRDLSISIAKEYNFLDVHAKESHDTSRYTTLGKERVRRLAVHLDGNKSTSPKCSFQKLHALFIFDIREEETQKEENGNFLQRSIMVKNNFVCLKVLDLEGTYKPKLPKALGKLIHLRYLGLRRTWLDKLPSSVADLFNLQTLDLKRTAIQAIPNAIWEMQQLRHLYLNDGVHSRAWIKNKNRLKSLSRNLRTLCGIFVGPKDCVTGGLEKLTKIRKLAIEGDLNSQGTALGDWINGGLKRLENLKLRSTAGDKKRIGTSSSSTTTIEEQSYALPWLGILRGHSCITKLYLEGKLEDYSFLHSLNMLSILTLVGTRIPYDPMNILAHLTNLRILRLWYNSYIGSEMVSYSGNCRKLEVLEVCWLDKLEHWEIKEDAMPNLRELEINKCNNLRKLPNGLEYLTNLKELRLPAMSDALKSRVLPITGKDWYKIKHIPFISPPLFSDAPFTSSASTSASAGSASTSHHPTV